LGHAGLVHVLRSLKSESGDGNIGFRIGHNCIESVELTGAGLFAGTVAIGFLFAGAGVVQGICTWK
jgi:hypothetical protein